MKPPAKISKRPIQFAHDILVILEIFNRKTWFSALCLDRCSVCILTYKIATQIKGEKNMQLFAFCLFAICLVEENISLDLLVVM